MDCIDTMIMELETALQSLRRLRDDNLDPIAMPIAVKARFIEKYLANRDKIHLSSMVKAVGVPRNQLKEHLEKNGWVEGRFRLDGVQVRGFQRPAPLPKTDEEVYID